MWQKEIPVANLVSGFWSPSSPRIFLDAQMSFVSTWLKREILSHRFIFLKNDNKLSEFPCYSFVLYGVATWRGQLSLLSLPPSDADIEINPKNE